MPANPGAKKAQEKAKKKRAEAQKARSAQLARAKARAPQVPDEETVAPDDDGSPFGLRGQGNIDFDELDELSAEAAVLIKKKKLDEAAKVCAQIVKKFPNEPDGWQRFGAVWEARGELTKALGDLERAQARASEEDQGTVRAIEVDLARVQKAIARGG